MTVEAIPAYDLTPGAPLHPKGDANGYVVSLGGTRILIAGVTQCVPEIQALEDITVAFMPMNPLLNGCVRSRWPSVSRPSRRMWSTSITTTSPTRGGCPTPKVRHRETSRTRRHDPDVPGG